MIYFIRSGGPQPAVKIGFTAFDDGAVRLKTLQVGNPEELFLIGYMEGNQTAESALHVRFRDQWIRGEWFRLTREVEKFISENALPPVAADHAYRNIRLRDRQIADASGVEAYVEYNETEDILVWKERSNEHFAREIDAATWNRRFAGRPAGYFKTPSKRVVKILGTVYDQDQVIASLRRGNDARSSRNY